MLVMGAAGCFVLFAVVLSIRFAMEARRRRDVLASNDPDKIPRAFKRKFGKKDITREKHVEEYRRMTSGGMAGLPYQHPFVAALIGSFMITVGLLVMNILMRAIQAR